MKRKIIEIDKSLCIGCSRCVIACGNGALEVKHDKVRLLGDEYCDGFGGCVSSCPVRALKIVERKAKPFNEILIQMSEYSHTHPQRYSCPCNKACSKKPKFLNNWPLPIMLVPEKDAIFENEHGLLIAADCSAFFCKDFHEKFVQNKTLLIGCPKLDDSAFYIEKLAAIFTNNDIKNITVLRIDVPCCAGLLELVKAAIVLSKKSFKVKEEILG